MTKGRRVSNMVISGWWLIPIILGIIVASVSLGMAVYDALGKIGDIIRKNRRERKERG